MISGCYFDVQGAVDGAMSPFFKTHQTHNPTIPKRPGGQVVTCTSTELQIDGIELCNNRTHGVNIGNYPFLTKPLCGLTQLVAQTLRTSNKASAGAGAGAGSCSPAFVVGSCKQRAKHAVFWRDSFFGGIMSSLKSQV